MFLKKRKISALAAVLTLIIAGSAVAAPGNGKGNGNGNGNGNGGGEPPPPVGEQLSIACIEWAPTGGRDQHIHVQAAVVDEHGNPVIDADVRMRRYKDGEVHAESIGGLTTTYGGLEGGRACPNGPPGAGFTADYCINSAATGYYEIEVLSVTKEGYTWDGVQPTAGIGYDHTSPK